jgi:hypothetical protein
MRSETGRAMAKMVRTRQRMFPPEYSDVWMTSTYDSVCILTNRFGNYNKWYQFFRISTLSAGAGTFIKKNATGMIFPEIGPIMMLKWI